MAITTDSIDISMDTNTQLLYLMQLVSPALPVGAYAYSQGFEYAVDQGWVFDKASTLNWVEGVMENSIAYLDLPLLIRFFNAWKQRDINGVIYWNDWLRAARETKELLLEDEQMGMALQRLLTSLGIDDANQIEATGYTAQFALAGVYRNIDLDALLQGFTWGWIENQVAAASKIVPLGQTDAQQVLTELIPKIPDVVEKSKTLSDSEIGAGLPALSIGSSRHEVQYSRLFRS